MDFYTIRECCNKTFFISIFPILIYKAAKGNITAAVVLTVLNEMGVIQCFCIAMPLFIY